MACCKGCTTIHCTKWVLIWINVAFLVANLYLAIIAWYGSYQDFKAKHIYAEVHDPNYLNVTSIELEDRWQTKKSGIVVSCTLVFILCMIGLIGAIRANVNTIITYDCFCCFIFVLLALGHRNYHHIWPIYSAILCSIAITVIITLFFIRAIKIQPYKIHQKILSNYRTSY